MDATAPLILLDVDGVLNPEQDGPGYRRHRVRPDGISLKLWLNRAHGPMLNKLVAATGAELVWASYWCDDANDWVGPRVGLPRLRFVPIPPRRLLADGDLALSLGAWKARHVASWVGTTPFVWLEDEPDVAECIAAEPGIGPHLIVEVDPVIGLTERHTELSRAWLDGLSRPTA